MTEARLAAGLALAALRRRVEAAGGTATVLARGDETAGAMLLVCAERGAVQAVLERAPARGWVRVAEAQVTDGVALGDYLARRRRIDPDLWIVELDIAAAERFAAEI